MDTNENTPLVAPNSSLPFHSTPTRGRKNALPLASVNSRQFTGTGSTTPRHRLGKTARLTCQTEVSTPGMTLKRWPRSGKRIFSEDIKVVAIQQIFGYEPRSWQLSLTEKVLEGHDAIGLAGTGAGKSKNQLFIGRKKWRTRTCQCHFAMALKSKSFGSNWVCKSIEKKNNETSI